MKIPADKIGHFSVGAAIGISGLWLGSWGLIPVLAFAIGKEVWDHFHPPHKADFWDFAASVAGGLCTLLAIAVKGGF